MDNSGKAVLPINEFNIGVRNCVIDKFTEVGINKKSAIK